MAVKSYQNPNGVSPNAQLKFSEKIPSYKSRYFNKLDLEPDNETHQKIVSYLLNLARQSQDNLQNRHNKWKALDRKQTAYIPLDEVNFDRDRSDAEVQDQEPHKPVSIVLPQSYATKDVWLTYNLAALGNYPIFRYESFVDPRDTIGNIILESLVDLQVRKRRMLLHLHTMLSDDCSYGFGAVGHTWINEKGFFRGQETVRYQGNELFSIDPYNALPDLNTPIEQIDKKTYFGWVERTDYINLRKLESSDNSIFNVKYMEKLKEGKSIYFNADDTTSGRYDQTKLQSDTNTLLDGPFDVLWMYAFCIPERLGLSNVDEPELWRFGLAADRILIAANPVQLDLNRIPVSVSSVKSDGHSPLVPSLLEIDYPLQHAMDFLWAARVTNLRKAINNMFIVDPSLVNMNDLVDTRAGMIARLRPPAWGRGLLNEAMQQIQVTDITANHLGDIQFLMSMRDRSLGIGDQMRGVQERRGSRVSSQEARDTRSAGLSRREKDARIFGLQALHSIGEWLASNTLQFMDGETQIRITGDYERQLLQEYGAEAGIVQSIQGSYASVDLTKLNINFDVVVGDGSMPSGEFADVWERLMNNAASHPETFQSLDFNRVWLHVARLMGAKNPQEFLKKVNLQPEVRPDAQVEKDVQAGNLVPVNGAL